MSDGVSIGKLLALLQYGARFPDFPENFTLPSLDPNYVPPQNHVRLERFCYFMLALAVVTVLLRLWIRYFKQPTKLGLDDWLMIPALIFAVGLIVDEILLLKIGGVGQHVYDIPYPQFAVSQKLEFAGVLLYYVSIYFVRISIAAFHYRLVGGTSSRQRKIIKITGVILTLVFIAATLTYSFSCTPIAAIWDMDIRLSSFKQLNISAIVLFYSICYTILDIWLLALPIHIVWSLQLPLETKVKVTCIFFLGGVACVGSIIKCIGIYSTFDSFDPTWNCLFFMIGSIIEVGFGIVSASMPALNFLIVAATPYLFRCFRSETTLKGGVAEATQITSPTITRNMWSGDDYDPGNSTEVASTRRTKIYKRMKFESFQEGETSKDYESMAGFDMEMHGSSQSRDRLKSVGHANKLTADNVNDLSWLDFSKD